MSFQRIASYLDSRIPEMIEWQADLTAIPALGPENGGDGEWEKARYLRKRMEHLHPDETHEIHAPDDRVSCGFRPNLVYLWKGKNPERRIWVLSHLDVVPAGERRLWEGDPFVLREQDGRLYGRGVEDNQHGIVASVMGIQALLHQGAVPFHDVGLVFVSDEETGSRYGLQYLLRESPHLFRPKDLIVVPDAGNDTGTLIEVAEKSMLWVRLRVVGKQCHASTPDHGVNSLRAAAHLVVALEELYSRFSSEDSLFHPPRSTFEPTKKEANVPNVNTIPGEDVFYCDCRVLPVYPLERVIETIREISGRIERDLGVRVKVEPVIQDQAAPPTDPQSPVVLALQKAVRTVYNRRAEAGGIGGGTVAAFFRRAGLPAAVWSTSSESAHQPNEYCTIEALVGDAKVFAHLFLDP